MSAIGITRSRPPAAGEAHRREPLGLEWAALAGMFVFAAWLLGVQGVWGLLLRSDPTGITLVIILVFSLATLWCGARARELSKSADAWIGDYLAGLRSAPRDAGAPLDLLLERTHGPHSTAWWVNAIQLKLGLLGKVIGFSVLALEIGQIQNFDPAQSQELLKALTAGLGIALLTTMVGLVGNILLGLQLTRLDRYADQIVARAQEQGLSAETG